MSTQKNRKFYSAGIVAFVLCAVLCFFNACANTKTSIYDVVVVGAGGAGLSAAISAREAGASVLILEKMPFAGGNTNYATGGLNASETSVQKKNELADSNEQFYQDTMKGGKNLNDEDLVRTLTGKSAETVDWLIGLGMDLSDVGKLGGATNKRAHRPAGGAAIGAHFVKVMLAAAEKAGAEIRYNTKVTGLIEKDGAVVGVTAEADGKTQNINARAVIIATGGFGANPAVLTSYKPELEGFGTTNHPGATGDAFEWIKPFNAQLRDPEQIQTHPTVVPVKNIMITEAVRGNGAIMLNRAGKRFEQEMTTRDVMSKAILAQDGKTAYLVFDQAVRESLKAIEKYAKAKLLTEAQSINDLATALQIDAATMEAEINRYNGFVTAKKDDDFARKDMPRAIEKPPFYAVEVGPAVHHTMGGLTINTETEVLTSDAKPIPGLFAAGEVTGGVHGANRLGGNAMADIAVFGKIAGAKAAAYVKGN